MSEQIKETEIMIGNIVTVDNPKCHPHLKDVPMIVKEIFTNQEYAVKLERVSQTDDPNTNYSQFMKFIRPIPLTEDILLNLGFEKRNTDQIRYKRDTIELTHVEFWDEDYDGNEFSFKEWKLSELYHSDLFYYKSFPSIQYLHQIQNLFKALTQTDLKVEV